MSTRTSSTLLALALLTVGSCASADTIYRSDTYVAPYYGAPINGYAVNTGGAYPSGYYYYGRPSVAGFVDRSAKTGIGLPAKAAKEALKVIF